MTDRHFLLFNVLETNDRILTSSMFWVSASNDLVNHLRKVFDKQIEISIKSMDTPSQEPTKLLYDSITN